MESNKWSLLSEIANHFGVDVQGFAAMIGYTRQSLYSAASGKSRLRKGRFDVVLYKLGIISRSMYEADCKAAAERHQRRLKLMGELQKLLVEREVADGK